MANPFTQNGAIPNKQSRFAPLYVNRFWTGLYSNSNPLSEAAVPFLYQKFYSGSRFETLRGGQNVEISPRLTLIRRPGNSVYNSQTFPAIATFYSFRIFNPITQQTQIKVIADTPTAVYDATGPSTKTQLFAKQSGAGQTSFQSVGNVLYAGDGVSTWKWLWQPAWTASTTFNTGDAILDPNGNLQVVSGVQFTFASPNTQSVGIASDVGTISWGTSALWTSAQIAQLSGTTVEFLGFSGASFLNNQTATIISAYNFRFSSITNALLTFAFSHADYGPTSDSGTVVIASGSAESGGSTPSWSSTIGGVTIDGGLAWVCKGPAVQDWGIVAPTAAPIVSNTLVPAGTAWAATTYYWPFPVILDSNSNLQLLTTDGTTSTVPTWATTPGATTADGTAVWTCIGPAARATSTAYTVGSYIGVTVTTTYKNVIGVDPHTHQPIYETTSVTSFYLFQCTVAGTTSATTTANLKWPSTLGGSIIDGSVSWVNAGYQVTRLNSSTLSPTGTTKGNVANSVAITQVASIVDNAGSGGGTGFTQNVVVAGISGSSHPTWTTTGSPAVEQAGLATTESGGLRWVNAGPVGAANTGSWVYAFSYENSVSGDESTASPLSDAVILQAQSVISISGNGDPNYATDGVDTINIYRSVQGFTTPFRLAQIAAPANGAPWSYVDASPDPPNPGSTLNEFISADTTGNNAPPPAGLTNLTFYLNRIFGNVGEFVYYSGVANQPVGVGAESWPGLNFFQMPELVNQSWPSATGILIFTVHGVYFSQGVDGIFNPNTPVRLLEDIGLLTPNLFAVNGSIPTIFTSDHQMLTLDPSSGISRVSDPIADLLASYSNTAAYLTWHVNGIDSAYFIADGSTGWYRLAPTSAPESGFTWSTNAQIVSGVKCVKSIETSPGVKQLLLGPVTSGPILARDLTTNADNGASYLASVTIGSLVFAQPNECGEIESITTTAKAIGSRPTVSILGDEISGTFELLQSAVNDPPFLNAPVSVYSDRWYFSQLQQPAWMRHMQMKIAWPAENFPNELLEYSIFGAIHIE